MLQRGALSQVTPERPREWVPGKGLHPCPHLDLGLARRAPRSQPSPPAIGGHGWVPPEATVCGTNCHVAAAGDHWGGTDREGRDTLLGVMDLGQAWTGAVVTSVHLAKLSN